MLSYACSYGQKNNDYFWLLGDETDDPDSYNGVITMDFNGGELNISKQMEGLDFFVTNSSISNDDGDLLFYSNGCKVFNAENELMQNGAGLNPGLAYSTNNCPDYGNTVPKGLMILPLPGNNSKYYIFHESKEQGTGVFSSHVAKLYYSLVDMSLNNGLGAVVEKNKVIIADTLSSGDLHAVRHANGEDWWIISPQKHKNGYFKVLFTSEGIEDVSKQNIGMDIDPSGSGGGTASFSPDGTKYARYDMINQLFLFDFDRSTGNLTNFQSIYVDTTEGFWGGLAFSSNSRYLYVHTNVKLWQFDLQAPDIAASKVLVGVYDGYKYLDIFPTYFFLMQLAPDCKIYMASQNGADILHVIHNPNEPGLACNFEQHGIKLPAVNNGSMPNFPNYRLGTPYPVCDSTIQLVVSSVEVLPPVREAKVYPNPATESLTLELPAPLPAEGEWRLFAVTGQQVRQAILAKGQTKQTISLAGVPPGLYFWKATSQGRRVGEGKVVVSR